MCKYLVNREDLGKRVTGYIVYNSGSKEFIGMTEKQVKDSVSSGEGIKGFVLDEGGNLALDNEGWKISNYMVRSGIGSLRPVNEFDGGIVNLMFVVVGFDKAKGYEVVNSRYARVWVSEERVKLLLEMGAIQGGAYMNGKKLALCDGVQVYGEETEQAAD